jgi:hypothetical protein
MPPLQNPFLKEKYNLHNAPEVAVAAKRTEIRTKLKTGEAERVAQDPEARIQNYLNRFTEITERKDPKHRERGLEALKHVLHKKFVIKPNEVPEGYFEDQRRLAREQGHGDIEISDEARDQLTEVIIADQESSLDKWVDYLSSPDATYPDWLKYWATRSITTMGEYDKEKHAFTKRSKGTTKPFPDLDREALAYVLDAVEKKYSEGYQAKEKELTKLTQQAKATKRKANSEFTDDFEALQSRISTLKTEQQQHITGNLDLNEADLEAFAKGFDANDFAKLYAWAIEQVTPASQEALLSTKGEWVKYEQGSDASALVKSLQGHGTGWCTAGESTAQAQLQAGDFYVYYSMSAEGEPTVPRAAIRMEEDRIAEVRGIAAQQNLDPHIAPVVQEKLKEFPDGKSYAKKASDMKLLTEIEKKTQKDQPLTKNDLEFLYELNTSIEGFGYDRDPRVEELRSSRNPNEDASVIFEYAQDQIAHSVSEINKDTKAYIGPLEPGLFDKLPETVEHVYTQFPEQRIKLETITIGGKSKEQLKQELNDGGFLVYQTAEYMMDSQEFAMSPDKHEQKLVQFNIGALGLERYTVQNIYARAAELGLELCPAEVGPEYRRQYTDQPMSEYVHVAMKPITDADGNPRVFYVGRFDAGAWLDDRWARPAHEWDVYDQVVFGRRK